ncbi:hypothetical protein TevJSym_ai00010 [endosymbiont of Tevnia jerichonana (vent Tica)]|uniref:Uncharacterized protein n=1 Tax=endosymbiont of Tevnia jerichonana (vent Tica) TaxID=1049564 RepID=G2FEF3_9GAMM|nr:hypothetical protein TevJSym_ai00010 [endosymbiont of Tevnia jerichonana (vent Tica)]
MLPTHKRLFAWGGFVFAEVEGIFASHCFDGDDLEISGC